MKIRLWLFVPALAIAVNAQADTLPIFLSCNYKTFRDVKLSIAPSDVRIGIGGALESAPCLDVSSIAIEASTIKWNLVCGTGSLRDEWEINRATGEISIRTFLDTIVYEKAVSGKCVGSTLSPNRG